MFKQVCLLTRRPGMSMEAFKDYYENAHAPLLAPMMPQALRYVRRFVQPEPGLQSGEFSAVPFDCLMELWWASREEFDACMASLGEGDAFQRIYADEEKIFASHDNPVFSVEERESPMRGWTDEPVLQGTRQADGSDGVLKLIFLFKRRPGMSTAEFRDYYESRHAKLGERAMPGVLRYIRRYVQPERNPITLEEIELPFDVVTEIWAESRAHWNAMQADLAGGELIREILADEKRLFAEDPYPVFTVEEADSPMRGW